MLCMCTRPTTRSFARANDANIVRSRDAQYTICLLSTSFTRFPHLRTNTAFCIACLNPPTEEGPSAKRLLY